MRTFLLILILFWGSIFPSFSYGQLRETVIEVTDEQGLKIINSLIQEGKRITEGRKACKAGAKDYKQECLCDKPQDYFTLYNIIEEAINLSKLMWIDRVLQYEHQGKPARTSLQYFTKINQEFDDGCLRNEDGTFRANHEWDKPELIVTDLEQIKQLQFIYNTKKNTEIATGKCSRSGVHSIEECACGYVDKYKFVGSKIKSLIQDYPELYDHILVYRYDGYTIRTSLEGEVRMLRYHISQCKK